MSNDLKTIRDVVTSDLTPAAYKQALEMIGSTCVICGQKLGKLAVAVYTERDRDPNNWAFHAHMSEGRIVSPGGFAHAVCACEDSEIALLKAAKDGVAVEVK